MSWSVPAFVLLLPLFLAALHVTSYLILVRGKRRSPPLPPGPVSLPLLGNIFDIDIKEPWKSYTNLATTYGSLMYIRMLDQDVIVVNSQLDAIQLFEKSSEIYSDRPFLTSTVPFGLDCHFGVLPYGDRWRLCRRIFHQTFRAEAALNLRPLQLRRARELVLNMVDDPTEYHFHYSTFSASVAMSVAYGYEPRPRDDPMIRTVERYHVAALPGTALFTSVILRLFPFVLHLPEWLPVLSMKRQSTRARKCAVDMVETPYKYVLEQMENGVDPHADSMVSDHVTRMQKYDESYRIQYEAALKRASATAYLGSAETTASTLMVFTLAMVLYPNVLKRAQREIDAIVGTNRLPEYHDRPDLPYVEAIMRETLRWQPILPLAFPHASTRSDVHKGFYIPKGAMVIGNIWAMSRDESRYPNAPLFIPERFLNTDGTLNDDDPAQFVFGFGRRVCAGRHMADASLWIAMVTMLATLDFSLAKDADGNGIQFEPTYENTMAHRLLSFPCSISLRSHIGKSDLERMLQQIDST